MSTETITVHDAEALDGMPDETLIRASGRYASGGGTFTDCWVRPVPQHIAGTVVRVWEVLVFGGQLPYSLTTAEDITYPVEVLYTDVEVHP
ncbi:MAG: hypothetical protein ACO1ON_12955 [Nocardioides sp.]